MRPDRGAAVAERVLHRYRHRFRHPRLRLDSRATSRRTARTRTLVDVTSAYCVLALMGPRARDVLARRDSTRTCPTRPSRSAPGARSTSQARSCARCASPTWASWAGSCTCPSSRALAVYERLMEAGEPRTASPTRAIARSSRCGSKRATAPGAAISAPTTRRSRRDLAGPSSSPRAYRSWGATRCWRSGRSRLKKRLACFTVDDPGVVLLGRETIYRDGQRVGWLSSAGWGYTVGKNIGFGYVRNADGVDDAMLTSGSYELEVAAERVACRLHLGAVVRSSSGASESLSELPGVWAPPFRWKSRSTIRSPWPRRSQRSRSGCAHTSHRLARAGEHSGVGRVSGRGGPGCPALDGRLPVTFSTPTCAACCCCSSSSALGFSSALRAAACG